MSTSLGMVVLLHGLARSPNSMARMERMLEQQGWVVCNVGYPSTRHDIATLAEQHVLPSIQACGADQHNRVHFVTHSMGGIVLRYIAGNKLMGNVGRSVMLSPPNQGSEVVDRLGDLGSFAWINGPAGRQLGTGEDSLPNQLGAADFEVGIITGNRSVNPILSTMIPGPDDGKVSVESAQLDGMRDFMVLPVSHPFIMRNLKVIHQVHHFLKHGQFDRPSTQEQDQ